MWVAKDAVRDGAPDAGRSDRGGSNFHRGLPQFRFPAFYTAPWFTILPLPFDPMGRIPVPIVFPPMTFDVNIIVQFADITFAPPELSAPVNIFFDA